MSQTMRDRTSRSSAPKSVPSPAQRADVRGRAKTPPGPLPPLEITYRSLAELVPYVRNARTHTPAQIDKIRASLARFGWTNPMLIAGNDMIAGHARLQAASAMAADGQAIPRNPDPLVGPTVDLSHLSAADRRAYVIADNRLAEDAGWDMDLLRIEMSELQLGGFDLTLTGFNLEQITEVLVPPGDPDEEAPDRELTAEEDATVDAAWQALTREWRAIMASAEQRGWLSTTTTRGALQVHYLRALYFGRDIPRTASLAYTPHRAMTSANKGSIFDQLTKACGEGEAARSARGAVRWATAERPAFDMFCCGTTMPMQGTRAPNDFPALLARDLIDEFALTEQIAVLDPCHGWGGRMLGFLLAERATHYHGFDPSPLSHAGVAEMFRDLAALTPARTKTATLEMLPFERATLADAAYDFAVTSPPYYDVEQYEGEASSHRTHKSFDAWVAGFYKPLIGTTARALKPGAVFALQVGSQQYPLKQLAIDIAPSQGLAFVETRASGMVNNRTQTEESEGEVIVILRKAK